MSTSNLTINLPKSIPFRSVTVKPWVKAFLVPRHIVRIDIDEPGKAGTHGWQVSESTKMQ